MDLINQPFNGQLGNHLITLLNSKNYHTLNIFVAFAKNSGVLRIMDSLKSFRTRGGLINIYIGIDLGGTSYEALTTLLLHTDSLNIIHSEKSQTFHSKIYQFLGEDNGLIIIGSNNLTGGGLWTNFESSVLIPLKCENKNDMQMLSEISDYIEKLTSLKNPFMQIKTQDDIDNLLRNDYIVKEVTEQVQRAKANARDKNREKLFGNGTAVKLPRLPVQQEAQTVVVPTNPPFPNTDTLFNDEQTIWFETRLLTGGSRNILDLSKKSLVEHGNPEGTPFDIGDPKFMRGGVWFFGIDPTATNETKNFTINFEGVDYMGNEIKYPEGERANGTWRLQIKGISSSEERITEAFRNKSEEHYLVSKIITFTKIEDDYFFVSVFPETELEDFKAASRILARNGSTNAAKLFGLL